MRILITTDLYLPHVGGILRHLQRISKEFVENGNEVAFLIPASNYLAEITEADKIKYYGVRSFSFPTYPDIHIIYPFQEKLITEYIEDFKPDVIHIHTNLSLARTTQSIANKMGIPVVGTNHFMSENIFTKIAFPGPINKFLDKLLWINLGNFLSKFEVLTTPSHWGVDYLIKNGVRTDIRAISNGIDLEVFNPRNTKHRQELIEKYHLPDNGKVLLFVGRIDREKNIGTILKTIKNLPKENKISLVLAGKGSDFLRLQTLTAIYNLTDRVVFTGFVDNKDLPDLYCYADIFIISSIAELQSIVMLEALASGLPALAADAGALPELVRDGKNGYLFNPYDTKALGEKILRIVTNENLAKKMRTESISIADEHDVRKIAKKFEQLYQEVISRANVDQPKLG